MLGVEEKGHFATCGPHSSVGAVGLRVSWEQGRLRAPGPQQSETTCGLRSRGCSAGGELPGGGAGTPVKDTCPASTPESHHFVRWAPGTDDDERLVARANRVLSEQPRAWRGVCTAPLLVPGPRALRRLRALPAAVGSCGASLVSAEPTAGLSAVSGPLRLRVLLSKRILTTWATYVYLLTRITTHTLKETPVETEEN